MTDPIKQFNLDLDRLLQYAPVSNADPALKTASVLLSLETESEVRPPAELRARWIAGTRSLPALKRNSPVQRLRSSALIAVLAAVICLLIISGGVYALARSLGYLPGLGVVPQGTQVRVLAAPVSRTREGVTITVKDAIWNADSILVDFEAHGLSSEKYSPLEPFNTCTAATELRFSNTAPVKPSSGETEPLDGGFTSQYKYESIPPDATDVTLFIPCIEGALAPGILPENWELPLPFIAAPPDFAQTLIPVLEPTGSSIPLVANTPEPAKTLPDPLSQATSSLQSETKPDTGAETPLAISQVIDAGDQYILIGSFNPPAPSQPGEWRAECLNLTLADDDGQDIYYQPPEDINLTVSETPHGQPWAIEFFKEFVPPLHISYFMRYDFKSAAQDTITLNFDAGSNPQQGQEWVLNREFQYAGHPVRLVKIAANIGKPGYIFWFDTTDPNISELSVRFDGSPSIEHLLQLSGTDLHGVYRWVVYEYYAESIPQGKLKMIPFDLYLKGETKSWERDWQP